MQPSGPRSLITTRRGHQTTITLGVRPSPAIRRRPVTLTANVVAAHAAANPASAGTVIFLRGSEVIGNVPLNAGVAKLTLTDLPPGRHTLSAIYQGDGILHSSMSEAVDLVIHEAPDAAYDGSSGFFSMVVMPDGGHLVTLESRSDALPASVRTLTAKIAQVPTSVEETIRPRQSAWSYAGPRRGQVLLASTDVDAEGLREPLLELRDAEWLPAEVFHQTSQELLDELTAPLAEPTGIPEVPGGGYAGGVQLSEAVSLFVPNRTIHRVPASRVLSAEALHSRTEPVSIPVMTAGRDGPVIRIFESAESTRPAPVVPTPAVTPAPSIEPALSIETDNDGDAGGFDSIFVG